MLGVTTKADFSDVLAGLTAAKDTPAPHRELKKFVVADQRDHAKTHSGPDGKWAPRALATVQKMRAEHVRRRPLGKLVVGGAVKYSATPRAIVGESKIPGISVAQQEGERVGRGVKLKARAFLWLSRSLLDTSARFIADSYAQRFGGR